LRTSPSLVMYIVEFTFAAANVRFHNIRSPDGSPGRTGYDKGAIAALRQGGVILCMREALGGIVSMRVMEVFEIVQAFGNAYGWQLRRI
jgi:hypothetical protein